MADFSVGGQSYKSGRMDCFVQNHVARRLAPLIPCAGRVYLSMASAENGADPLLAMAPIMDVFSKISDADADYIIKSCLAVTQRRQGDLWAPCLNGSAVMFQDINLFELYAICWNVLKDNLANFFNALPREFTDKLKG